MILTLRTNRYIFENDSAKDATYNTVSVKVNKFINFVDQGDGIKYSEGQLGGYWSTTGMEGGTLNCKGSYHRQGRKTFPTLISCLANSLSSFAMHTFAYVVPSGEGRCEINILEEAPELGAGLH